MGSGGIFTKRTFLVLQNMYSIQSNHKTNTEIPTTYNDLKTIVLSMTLVHCRLQRLMFTVFR